jgi:hypothetical protein
VTIGLPAVPIFNMTGQSEGSVRVRFGIVDDTDEFSSGEAAPHRKRHSLIKKHKQSTPESHRLSAHQLVGEAANGKAPFQTAESNREVDKHKHASAPFCVP